MNFTAEGDLDEVTEIHDVVTAFAESRRLNFEGGFVEPRADARSLFFCEKCNDWIDGLHTDAQLERHHPSRLEDPIDYEYGVRALTTAEVLTDADRTFQRQTRQSISVYAARVARERDEACEALAALYVELRLRGYCDLPRDVMVRAELAANAQLAKDVQGTSQRDAEGGGAST